MRYTRSLLVSSLLFIFALLPATAGGAASTDPAAEEMGPPITSPELAVRPDAPQMDLDLGSPRGTLLRTFFPAINRINRGEGDIEQAWAHVLATMQWEDVLSEAEARRAAMQLLEVFDKLGEITEEQLPSDQVLRDADVSRFVFFPQPEHHADLWEALRAFDRWPDGQIVLERTEAGWQFSAQTVAGIDRLAESMAPLPPKHLAAQVVTDDGVAQLLGLLGPTFEFTPWWGWLALLGLIFAGLAVGKIAGAVLQKMADRLRRRGWAVRAVVFEDAARPLSLACLTFGLTLGVQVFVHIEDDSSLEAFVANTLTLLYLIALGWFLFNLVDVIDLSLRRVTETTHNKVDDMIVPLIRKALRIFIVVIFIMVIAQNVFELNITGWLAGLGIAGLAVSLAAQDSIRNLFGSLTVFFDKPFAVGDMITFNGTTGTVEEIGFRSTKQRLFTGAVVTVPNMKFIDNAVENVTRRQTIRRVMNITITYDTPVEKIEQAVQILKDILHSEAIAAPFDMEETPPRVFFNEFNADSLNIMAIYWYVLDADKEQDWWGYNAHLHQVNVQVFQRFQEAGIDFAFPTRTLYLAGDKDRQLSFRLLRGRDRAEGNGEPAVQ
ncbi:MAG: mechanosensitive ion channel family protein [Phycisphaeraceae bacterium]